MRHRAEKLPSSDMTVSARLSYSRSLLMSNVNGDKILEFNSIGFLLEAGFKCVFQYEQALDLVNGAQAAAQPHPWTMTVLLVPNRRLTQCVKYIFSTSLNGR